MPFPTGGRVLWGDELAQVFETAKEQGFALPAFNCTSSSTVNAVLEGAKKANSPVIIQISQGGGINFAGKGTDNTNQQAAVIGSIAAAFHVHQVAPLYGVPIILHTDHCAKKLLPWVDGVLDAGEKYFAIHHRPLYSSHMLDLSEESLEENISICEKYLPRLHKIGMFLEIELGCVGGVEDGVGNEDNIADPRLYSQPQDIWEAVQRLSKISTRFTIAATFGNVHGVYKPGNVKLQPIILKKAQEYVAEQLKDGKEKPVYLVFHGGSGSELDKIHESLGYGVVKFNIDTDTQWAYWDGVRQFSAAKHGYLQSQVGNPEGPDKPNKNYYDPRVWLREGEKTMVSRVVSAFDDLRATNVLGRFA